MAEAHPAQCDCICHSSRGVVGQGGTWIYDDDLGIRHEDWFDCSCACAASDEQVSQSLRRADRDLEEGRARRLDEFRDRLDYPLDATQVIHCPRCGLTVSAPKDEPLPVGGSTCAMGHEPVQMVRVVLEDVNRG